MATRFYFDASQSPAITPNFDAGWEATGSAVRRNLRRAKRTGDSIASGSAISSTSGQDALHRQYISDPLKAGHIFNTGVTYKCYLRALESAANDNIRSRLGLRILSEDGATVRHTVLAIADYSTGAEWNTALRNKAFADGDAGSGSYTTVEGDRICLEVGHNDSAGVSISGTTSWGSNAATDHGENETETAANAPWFETSLNLTFLYTETASGLAAGAAAATTSTKTMDNSVALAASGELADSGGKVLNQSSTLPAQAAVQNAVIAALLGQSALPAAAGVQSSPLATLQSSLSLAIQAAQLSSTIAEAFGSLIFPADASTQHSALSTQNFALGLTAQAGMDAQRLLALAAETGVAASAALDQPATASLQPAVALAAQTALDAQRLLALAAETGLAASAASGEAVGLLAQAASALSAYAAVQQLFEFTPGGGGGATYDVDLALAALAGVAEAAQAGLAAVTTVRVQALINEAVDSVTSRSLVLAAASRTDPATSGTLSAGLSLPASADLLAANQRLIDQALTLHSQGGLLPLSTVSLSTLVELAAQTVLLQAGNRIVHALVGLGLSARLALEISDALLAGRLRASSAGPGSVVQSSAAQPATSRPDDPAQSDAPPGPTRSPQ